MNAQSAADECHSPQSRLAEGHGRKQTQCVDSGRNPAVGTDEGKRKPAPREYVQRSGGGRGPAHWLSPGLDRAVVFPPYGGAHRAPSRRSGASRHRGRSGNGRVQEESFHTWGIGHARGVPQRVCGNGHDRGCVLFPDLCTPLICPCRVGNTDERRPTGAGPA